MRSLCPSTNDFSRLSIPLKEPFGPSAILQPTMPSADFCLAVSADRSALSQFLSHARSQGTRQISQGKTQNVPRVDAEFIKHVPRENGGLRGHVPARPERATPQIRFVYLAPRFWIELPSDPASRRRPCPSPSLRLLLYLTSGLSPDSLCAMLGTHVVAQRRASARPLECEVSHSITRPASASEGKTG